MYSMWPHRFPPDAGFPNPGDSLKVTFTGGGPQTDGLMCLNPSDLGTVGCGPGPDGFDSDGPGLDLTINWAWGG